MGQCGCCGPAVAGGDLCLKVPPGVGAGLRLRAAVMPGWPPPCRPGAAGHTWDVSASAPQVLQGDLEPQDRDIVPTGSRSCLCQAF